MFSISKRPTIAEIHSLYQNKKATPSQVVQFFYHRIAEIDPKLNSFIRLTEGLANSIAQKQDEVLKIKSIAEIIKEQPLFGIPFAIKDIILAEDVEFSAASQVLKGYIAPYSSTVYKKILQSGAILIGVNNMDQFAMGSSGQSSYYGATKNPFDLDRIPGGSSSGGAACVGAGLAVFSLGTDTGGSIRQPAAFCDVVGLKPTYGLVSRYGVIPMSSSLDQVGPMTNCIADNIIVTTVLAGKDDLDQTSIDSKVLVLSLEKMYNNLQTQRQSSKLLHTYKPLTIGLPKEFFDPSMDVTILQTIQDLVVELQKLGHKIIEISLPLNKYALAVYYMTMTVEVASNLERLDGVRYAQQTEYQQPYTEHRELFGEEVKRRIMLGSFASSSGYLDAYYNKAQIVRELTRQSYLRAFEKCDIILTPTTPEFPFKLGEKTDDPIKMYLSDIYTCGINPVRIPGLAVPLGLYNYQNQKLPIGCQLLAPELAEDRLFALGLEIENLYTQTATK